MAGVNGREAAQEGGLLSFARALVAAKGEKGTAPPPPPAPSAPPAPVPPPAPPELAAFEARVGSSLARIAAAARSPGMQGDHYREVFVALAGVVELMPAFVREVRTARHPIPDEAVAEFLSRLEKTVDERAAATLKRESARWFRAFDRRTNAAVALGGAALFVLGFLGGVATAVRLAAAG